MTAASLLLLGAPAVAATPPDPGVTGKVLWQRTVGVRDLVLREIHIPPGADNGWHYHDGPLYAWVKKGTLTHYDATCNPDGVYRAGRLLVERSGRDQVHIGRNLGKIEVVLKVLYVLPAGKPLSEDAPNPGCDFE
jgi:quercetin dioxygenase-like cupin family protein